MEIFTEHKTEWIIGIACTFLPAIIGEIIKRTSNIPNITIPFWLFCLLVSLIPAYFAVTSYSAKTKDIANKTFGVERVIIDGKHFANCKFVGTELVFLGKKPFSLSGNEFTRFTLKFEGDSALTTRALIALYADEGFRPIIDAALENIKKEGLARSAKKN